MTKKTWAVDGSWAHVYANLTVAFDAPKHYETICLHEGAVLTIPNSVKLTWGDVAGDGEIVALGERILVSDGEVIDRIKL